MDCDLVKCLCGIDAATAAGREPTVRYDIVCPKHDAVAPYDWKMQTGAA